MSAINIIGGFNMMTKPHDNCNFRRIIESGTPYIDKTLFIKSVMQENAQRLILCRPSRTGKSPTFNLHILLFYSN